MSIKSNEIDPENASYFDTLGWIYYKMKNYKLTKNLLKKSLQINGNSAVVLEHLGDVFCNEWFTECQKILQSFTWKTGKY